MRLSAFLITLVLALPLHGGTVLQGCSGLSVQLRPDGKVFCLGRNDHGQLGCGSIGGQSNFPVQVQGLPAIKQISTGDDYVLALDWSGNLWAWGSNSALVLGPNATADSGTPVEMPGMPPLRYISAGHAHCLAVDNAGQTWGWGTASYGELGGSVTTCATPIKMPSYLPASVREVAAGWDFSLALSGAGTIYVWGNGANGGLGYNTTGSVSSPSKWPPPATANYKHIVAGKQVLALTPQGTVVTWGYGAQYQTGLGRTSTTFTPTTIPGLSHVKDIMVMGDNSGAIDSNGQLWVWGANANGSLGLGVSGPVQNPAATGITGMTSLGGGSDHLLASGPAVGIISTGSNSVGQAGLGNQILASLWEPSFLDDHNAYGQIAAGNGSTYCLTKDGLVHSVGRNDAGQLVLRTSGASTTSDSVVPGATNIIGIQAGDRFVLMLRADHRLLSGGNNDYGELGVGNMTDASAVQVIPGLANVSMYAAGADHCIAVTSNGYVYTWGRNQHYQLGNGTTNEETLPTQITGFAGTPLAVSANGDHTLLLTTTGLYSFGSNSNGECGQGSLSDVQSPTLVTGLSSPLQIAAGRHHTLVLTTGGLYAFGSDANGELGDGANTNQSTPELVSLPAWFSGSISSIQAGNGDSFIIDSELSVWSTGLNSNGQLGIDSTDNTSTFTQAGMVAMEVAAGFNHTVVGYPGMLASTGDNTYGEQDNGTQYSYPYFLTPAFQNSPITNSFVSIAGGATHSLAVDESGGLWGFGDNTYSELGDGGTTSRLVPTLTASNLNLIAASAGSKFSLALDAYGHVWGFGLSSSDQAGTGNNQGGAAPQQLNISGAIQVSCGYNHATVLRDDGTVVGFGDNSYGALTSAASKPSQLTPIQLSGLSSIVGVSSGSQFSAALGNNGFVYTVGLGTSGQIGNGATTSQSTPVGSSLSAIGVSAGAAHVLAVEATGAGMAWGSGSSGQNGSSSLAVIKSPTQIATGVLTPVAGGSFSLFLAGNGSTLGLGDDSVNQLNDYLFTNNTKCATLSYTSPLSCLVAGSKHALGLAAGALLLGYGDNSYGQLGTNQEYTAAPPAPTNLTATLNGTNEIDLSWQISARDQGASYEIDESTNGGLNWTMIDLAATQTTSFAATGLAAGTTYTFRLIAQNREGTSPPAQSSPVQTPYPIPGAPTSFFAVATGSGAINLSWVPADHNATSYTVVYSTDGGINWSTLTTTTQTSYSVSGLIAGANYQFQVFGVNGNQVGGADVAAGAATAVLGPISNLGAILSGADVNLSWNPTDSFTTGYIVEASANGGPWNQIASFSNSDAQVQYSATNLQPGTSYTFQVFATNAAGQTSVGLVTSPLTTPYAIPTSLSNLQVAVDPSGNFIFTWTDTNGTNESEILIETVAPDGTVLSTNGISAGTTSYTASPPSGVSPNQYQFVVQNSAGTASTSGATILPIFQPSYAMLDLGYFAPKNITDDGIVTGVDQAGHLARWTGSGITELTVAGSAFQPGQNASYGNHFTYDLGAFSVNNSGSVVSSFISSYGGPVQGVAWSAGQTDATPVSGASYTQTDFYTQTTETVTGDLYYTGIDDAGNVYSFATVSWPVDLNGGNPNGTPDEVMMSPMGSITTYYDMNLPAQGHSGGFEDGFLNSTELGVAPTSLNSPATVVNTATSASSSNSLEFFDEKQFSSWWGVIAQEFTTLNGQQVNYSPACSNDLGMYFVNDSSGVGYYLGTDLSNRHSVWPFPGDYIEAVNSKSNDWTGAGMFGGYPCALTQLKNTDGSGSGIWTSVNLPLVYEPGVTNAPTFDCVNNNGSISGTYANDLEGIYDGFLLIPAELGVDANNDGKIVLHNDPYNSDNVDSSGKPSPPDTTDALHPYRFWVNNDHDALGANSDYPTVQNDAEPTATNADYLSGRITCTRDLEDYSLLCVYIGQFSDQIRSGAIQVGISISSLGSGNPSLELFDSYEQDGGTTFRTDAGTANLEQLGPDGNGLQRIGGVVNSNHPLIIPSSYFRVTSEYNGLSDSNRRKYFLFEASGAGKGEILLTFYDSNGNVLGSAPPLFVDFEDIKNMYERWTVGDAGGATPWPAATLSTRALPTGQNTAFQYSSAGPEQKEYIVFVHGWNMIPWEKDSFAETAFKRLHWQGYNGRFAAFQWPTTYGFDPKTIPASLQDYKDDYTAFITDRSNYDDGEYSAWRSASAFTRLLETMNRQCPGMVNVFAHSMGNVVAGESLRLLGQTGQKINCYVASQAAVEGEAFDAGVASNYPITWTLWNGGPNILTGTWGPTTPDVYSAWLSTASSGVKTMARFYNENDFALQPNVWELDQMTKPDQTGTSTKWGWGISGSEETDDDQFYNYLVLTSYTPLHLGTPTSLQDRYQIMSYAAQSWSRALGRIPGPDSTDTTPAPTADVDGFHGSINLENQAIWLVDPAIDGSHGNHRDLQWHSAEFEFTNDQQMVFWNRLMTTFSFQPNESQNLEQ